MPAHPPTKHSAIPSQVTSPLHLDVCLLFQCPLVEMAATKFVLVMAMVLLAVLLLESEVLADHGVGHTEGEYHLDRAGYGQGSLRIGQCPGQCSRRCGRTQYKKACLFFCNKCCKKCLCVPPGYYGNKAACPCYNNWKTKEGGPKCP